MNKRTAQVVAAATITAVTLAVTATNAMAQVPDPAPDGSMPGAALVTSVLGWLKWGALAAAVGGILGGGVAVGVGHFGNNYGAASAGRKWVLGGIGAAALATEALLTRVQVGRPILEDLLCATVRTMVLGRPGSIGALRALLLLEWRLCQRQRLGRPGVL